jgi:uncharacterized protein (DUF983 family)
MISFLKKVFKDIETDIGRCPECDENVVFISIVHDYYKCTNCGEEIRQYVNGHIKYLAMTKEDRKWLKENRSSE